MAKKTDLNTGKVAATDVTKAKQATTQGEVDQQDARTRLWQALDTTYDQAIEESGKQYDLNRGAADRAALARGMGRSSYNLATMANIDTQKAQAADRLQQQKIAEYQKGLGDIEAQEKEDQRWQEQFAYQKERDKAADTQWERQFTYQQGRDQKGDEQWEKQFAYQQGRAAKEDEQWQKQFEAGQSQWQQQFEYQKGRDQKSDEQWQKQFDAQLEQWRQQFDYQQKSDSQKLAYSYLESILAAGGDPSAALLEQAGLSWADWQSMKQQTQAQATGGSPSPRTNPPPTTPPPGGPSEDEWLRQFEAGYTQRGGAVVGTATDKKGGKTSVVYIPEKVGGKTTPQKQVTWKKSLTK